MTDEQRREEMSNEMSGDPRRVEDGLPQTDEMRRTDDLAPTGQDAPAGAPTGKPDWNAQEWEGDNQPHHAVDESARAAMSDAVTGEPKWNEHEVVGEGQGGPNEGPTERTVPTEGDNELSGHGHNPGGGERFGDVDRGLPDDQVEDPGVDVRP